MKGNGLLEQDHGEAICPKRLWVLTALTDDELLDQGDALPQGLRFHLARCESCRQLADRLLLVTSSLHEISGLESASDLADRADAQAVNALRTGAKLTGRVTIPDEPEVEVARPGRVLWLRFGRVAAAAAIVFGLSLLGVQHLSQPSRHAVVENPPAGGEEYDRYAPGSAPSGEAEPHLAGEPERLADNRPEEGSPPTLPYHIPRYDTHYEAALADDPGSVQAAFPRPRVGQRSSLPSRGFAWRGLFDRPAPIESTAPSPNER